MTASRKVFVSLLLLLPLLSSPAPARDAFDPRLQIGIGLLPAVMAANKRLSRAESGQSLPVYLVYRENLHLARQLGDALALVGEVRGHPLEINSISFGSLHNSKLDPLSTIFLVEPLGGHLDELVKFASEHQLLLFSPFKGDVERGASAGFQVTHKVLPAVNMTTLKASKIQLKAFFLRVAVKYE